VALDPFQIVVMLIGFIAGAGVIDRDLMPYIFYYVVAPLLSGIIMVKLLETIPSLGMDFGFDRYLHYMYAKQGNLAKAAGLGLSVGFVGNQVFARFSEPKKKKPKVLRKRSIFGDKVSMVRRRHLKTLDLTPAAGPRDMFLAWTKLSAELQGSKWQTIMKERGLDCSEDEFKEWVDEAYTWLRANGDQPVSVAKKKAAPEPVKKQKKKRGNSVQKSRHPKMQIRGL